MMKKKPSRLTAAILEMAEAQPNRTTPFMDGASSVATGEKAHRRNSRSQGMFGTW